MLILNRLVTIKSLNPNHLMHNTYANFAKIHEAHKHFPQELANKRTNGCHQPRRFFLMKKAAIVLCGYGNRRYASKTLFQSLVNHFKTLSELFEFLFQICFRLHRQHDEISIFNEHDSAQHTPILILVGNKTRILFV